MAESTPIDALPALPRDEGGPVFAEPWQAQAFAMAVSLSQRGCFTWPEWAAALAAENAARGDDTGTRYYELWLAALEKLVTAKGLLGAAELAQRKVAWEEAVGHTEFGHPIELDHHHDPQR
ncbi:MAG TPA: nitrile hydratase accessory protein [Stellaceae bacterium]|nr:nitrile hydratase accessory protein [Stellaceae bacterium]